MIGNDTIYNDSLFFNLAKKSLDNDSNPKLSFIRSFLPYIIETCLNNGRERCVIASHNQEIRNDNFRADFFFFQLNEKLPGPIVEFGIET